MRVSLERVSRAGTLELSSGQRRLWFLNRLSKGNPVYNSPMGWRLRGRLDVGALERAWGHVVARHEALRTRFEEGEGSVWQVVEDPRPVRLEAEECGSEEELLATSREEGRRGFDLERGPVYRLRLLRLGEEEHVLLLTVHHVAWDWWSMGVVERELGALYGASLRGGEAELPELDLQYADYAAWQRMRLANGELEPGLAYWRERLAGMPGALEVPLDNPRPASGTSRGGVVRFELGGALMRRLDKLSRKSRTTLYMTLLGAWQGLLSRYTGRGDVVVGTPIANRTRRELEGLVGFFVNTLVLRTDLGDDPTLEEMVRRARETAVGAFEHAEVSFEQLVEELKPERDLSRSPLVQVTFQLQGAGRGLRLEGLEVSRYLLGSTMARFDLDLNVVETGAAWLVYAEELYERESMERLVGHWQRVLEAMVGDPGLRLSEVELPGLRAPDATLQSARRIGEQLAEGGGGYAAPESEIERVLVGIWEEVLGLERVGVEDTFFQLGGHSLMAMRMMMLIRETYGVELDLRKLFELQTVRALAPALEAAVTETVMAMSEEQALAQLAELSLPREGGGISR
jgi:acyl carrier protein